MRSPLPAALRYESWAASWCTGAAVTVPGRWRLTSRSVPGGTVKAAGSLNASAPAGTRTPARPRPKVSGTGAFLAAAPVPRTAMLAAAISTGAAAKVLAIRIRGPGPPAPLCTTSRSVRSVHGPTAR